MAALILFLVVLILIAYPPLYLLIKIGISAAFQFLHGDSFLYLAIAKHSTFEFITYNGEFPTNGYNPLWQWLLIVVFKTFHITDSQSQLMTIFLLSIALVSLGMAFTSLAIYNISRSWLISLITIPGVYYLLVGSLFNNQSAWDNINGMESATSIFFGGVLLWYISRDKYNPTLALGVGLLLPWLILSRLDDVFIIPGFLLALRFGRDTFKAMLQLCLPTIIVILGYIVYNKTTVGSFLPLSGMEKFGFSLPASVYIFLVSLFPPLSDLKNIFSDKQSNTVEILQNSFRSLQIFYPIIFAYFFWRIKKESAINLKQKLILGLCFYLIIKAGYNLLFVHLWHQGPWYYSFPILCMSFLGAILVNDAAQALRVNYKPLTKVLSVFFVMFLLFSSSHVIFHHTSHTPLSFQYWTERNKTTSALETKVANPKLINFDDGITAFALPYPCIHGFGFASDPQSYAALKEGRFLRFCYQKGYTILTSAEYMSLNASLEDSKAIRTFLKKSFLIQSIKDEMDMFDLEWLYTEPVTKSPFIQLKLK